MRASLRPARADAPYLLTVSPEPFSVRKWLERKRSGLASCRFTPSPDLLAGAWAIDAEHDAASWINRCALRFSIKPQAILQRMQLEQGLALDPTPRTPAYRVETLPLEAIQQDGPGVWKSKGRWVRLVEGDERMVKACGYGIPDPGMEAPWDVAKYLGFDRQVFHCARGYRSSLDAYARGARIVRGVSIRDTTGTSRVEDVECLDAEAYALLTYTPHWRTLDEYAKTYRTLFG